MFAGKMVATCTSHNCYNKQTKNPVVSFHRFPLQNPQLLRKWLIAMKREDFEPNKFSFLCSDHFTPADYESRPFGGRCKLKYNAVPSVFNFPDYFLKQEVSQKPCLVKQEFSQDSPSETNISSATNSSIIYSDHMYCGLNQESVKSSLSLLKTNALEKQDKQLKQKGSDHKYDDGLKQKDPNIGEEEVEDDDDYRYDTEVRDAENTEVEEDDEDVAASKKKDSEFVRKKTVQNNSSGKEFVLLKKKPVTLKRKNVFQEDPRVLEAYKIMKTLHRQMNDDCSVFTEHIANKLRSYDTHTRAVVELLINNILFEADIGTYKEDSD